MTTAPLDHLIVAFLALAAPWLAVVEYRRLVRSVEERGPGVRSRHYGRVIVQEWLACAIVVAGWLGAGRSLPALGLGYEPGGVAWLGMGLTLAASGLLVAQTFVIRHRPEEQAAVREQLRPVRPLLPHTRDEARRFYALSLTAGICEEVVYRGFLMAYFAGLGALPAVVLSSLVFAAGHVYLGPAGATRAGAVGLVTAGLYWLTGSLWAPMLLHAVLDVTSGAMARAAFRSEPEPAAR